MAQVQEKHLFLASALGVGVGLAVGFSLGKRLAISAQEVKPAKPEFKLSSTQQRSHTLVDQLSTKPRKKHLDAVKNRMGLDMADSIASPVYNAQAFPAIKKAFGKKGKEQPKHMIFLYSHLNSDAPQGNQDIGCTFVDWTTGQDVSRRPFKAVPCRLKKEAGYVRFFGFLADSVSAQPGLRKTSGSEQARSVNGIAAYAYNDDELEAMKSFYRESGRASLVKIDVNMFEAVTWEALPKCVKHIYSVVPDMSRIVPVSAAIPILQSYLDTVLHSYTHIVSSAFAAEFLRTTVGWSNFWLDDRADPRRPWTSVKEWRLVESLCSKFPRSSAGGPNPYFAQRWTSFSRSETESAHEDTFDVEYFSGDGTIEPTPKQWMFGYGSLMNTQSRTSSSPSATNVIPVTLAANAGWKRVWNYRATKKGDMVGAHFVALGVERDEHKTCSMNAIVYPLAGGTTLEQIREREEGYEFIQLDTKDLTAEIIHSKSWTELPPGIEVWMCGPPVKKEAARRTEEPTALQPLLQSYVDVCMSGCMEFSQDFAANFVKSTYGWNKFWINDREIPRRPWVSKLSYQKPWKRIDTILNDCNYLRLRSIPEEFSARNRDHIVAATKQGIEERQTRGKEIVKQAIEELSNHKVIVFHKQWCPYCQKAINALKEAGVPHEAIHVTPEIIEHLEQRTSMKTSPWVYAGGAFVGGCNDGGLGGTLPLLKSGHLGELLASFSSIQDAATSSSMA